MTARTASLRVGHARGCPNAGKTALGSAGKGSGCTCQPSYFTAYRGRDGRPIYGPRVKDKRTAERALRAIQVEIEQGRAEGKRAKTISFDAWADQWKTNLELANPKASTVRAYMVSVGYARDEFGGHDLREIGNDDLRALVTALRKRGQADVSIAKHLRHLSACFQAALADEYIDVNPVGRFRATFKLNVQQSEANYFSDGELQRLWAQLRVGLPHPKTEKLVPVAPVYLHLCRFAVVSGARIGELVALRWRDIRLGDGPHGEVRITKAWNDVDGETLPKTRKSYRTLHLTQGGQRVLEDWVAVCGVQADGALVFPNSHGNHLAPTNLNNRILNPALAAAGIAKVGEDSPEPRSFHTFRHCFARLMLENGQPLQWVADELGHESTATTERVYGHWAKQARQAQAAAVPASALPV